MNISVVTTCSARGWTEYGERMVVSFREHWPDSVRLLVYTEGFDMPDEGNVSRMDLPEWFEAWKRKHSNNPDAHGRDQARNRPRKPHYDFRRDCVKFAHKIAALTDAALRETVDRLVWMDADTITHAPVDQRWIGDLARFRSDQYLAWLDRARTYPECGFLIFNGSHSYHDQFMRRLRYVYEADHVFKLGETHDSFVIQKLVDCCVEEGQFPKPLSLSGSARVSHHPFVLSPLGERLDHLKGPRKAKGRTPSHEVGSRRAEKYWR